MLTLTDEKLHDRHSMTRLYKYMSGEGALRLFRSGMLRFTQPVEFNDPFEMLPFVKGLADEPTLENQFREGLGKTLDPQIDVLLGNLNLTAEQKARIDRKSIHEIVQSQAPEAIGLFKMFAQIMTPLVDRQIYKTVNESLGALYLTEKSDNLLMWAHYADHHRGIVIEFDQSHAFFNRRLGPQDDFRHFRKVVYTQDRPNVFLSDSDAVDFFYFKGKEWEYEQEWRLIVPLVDCSQRIDRTPDCPMCLFRVPPECIRSIIVECQACVEEFAEERLRKHYDFPEFKSWLQQETILYLIVRGIFRDCEVLRHAKPHFLGGLELDILDSECRYRY